MLLFIGSIFLSSRYAGRFVEPQIRPQCVLPVKEGSLSEKHARVDRKYIVFPF
jgi:hypothetical protein